MGVIKQIAIYTENGWENHDIGVSDAINVTYSSNNSQTVLGLYTVEGTLKSVFPNEAYQQQDRDKVLVLNSAGLISSSNISSTELSRLSGIRSSIQEQLDDIHLSSYPIGSVYCSVIGSINPNTLLGGTWEEIQDLELPFYAWKRIEDPIQEPQEGESE